MGKTKIGNYRWAICAMLFFGTTINYIDRQVIGLLKPILSVQFHWTEIGYGYIVMAFAAMYALGYLVFGNFIDKVGSKIGYGISAFVWSVAAVLHAFVTSMLGFGIVRGLLGISEAGNFPAGVKAVAEWFPKKERGLATGIFNSGTSVGAFIAPFLVPLILGLYGWKAAFWITGALGFVWLAVWIIFYEIPTKQKRLKQSELDYINSDLNEEVKETPVKIKWSKLLGLKQTWVFILGKVLTDPIWWFFLFWLPSYFADTFKLNLTKPSTELVVIYFCSTFGSIAGGYLSSYFIKLGWPALKARKTSLLIAAISVTPIFLVKYSTNIWQVVAIMSLAMAAHQAWSTNIFTIVSDIVPKKAVSSVVGLGGMSGSIASTLFPLLVGSLLAYYKNLGHITAGYNILFIIAGCTYLLTILIIHLLTKKMKPIEI